MDNDIFSNIMIENPFEKKRAGTGIKNDKLMKDLVVLLNSVIEVINTNTDNLVYKDLELDELFYFSLTDHFELTKSFKEYYFDTITKHNCTDLLVNIPKHLNLSHHGFIRVQVIQWIIKNHPMIKLSRL